jgi:glutathione S-transferase
MNLKLIYFKMRALAEAPRILFHYTGIEFEDLMSWEYYGEDWSITKPKVSFKQLPVLIIDDKHEVAQSIAILNYIEKIAGLDIKDQIQSAKADAILQSAQELFAPLNPTVNFATGENFIEKGDTMKPILMSRFDDFDRILTSSGKKYFIDEKPHACDFAVFHHLDLSKKLDPTLIENFPRLEKFIYDISSIDSVANYLNNRPELIDVSIEPKLLINGIPHPTGVKQT